jgi:hypothetical protein
VQVDVNEDYNYLFISTMFMIKHSKCSRDRIKTFFRKSREVASIYSNQIQFAFTNEPRDKSPLHDMMFETIEQRLRETDNDPEGKHH